METEEEIEYSYWTIWCRTFEGDSRWHTGRFLKDVDAEDVSWIVRSTLNGGVGGDPAELLEVEESYEDRDKHWRDYSDIKRY